MATDELKKRIAGEIALSQNPGATMKKWRELFGISQAELADYLKITPSTISDYENNRRKSPGIQVIKRFVDAIVRIDERRGGLVINKFMSRETEVEPAFEIHNFSKPVNAKDLVRAIEGKVITNKRRIKEITLDGYSIVDSLRAITELPVEELPKIYGLKENSLVVKRAIVFTKVTMGRSPMVAIRVTSPKPAMVIYQGLSDVRDPVARRISEVEKVPIVVTDLDTYEIKMKLKKFE